MDVRSLTQQEAEERAGLLRVTHHQVDLDLTGVPDGPQVRATSTVQVRCIRPGATSFLDCCAEVVRATLNGRPLAAPQQGRLALPDLAADNLVVVETVQSNTTDGEAVHRAVDPGDGEVYLWTSFEPDEARFAWACFDQPDLKAPWGLRVTAPEAWTVLSNSGDPTVEDLPDGAGRRWIFADTPPLSSYNPVVLAGPFHAVHREVGGHDLSLYARRSLADLLERDAEEILTVTGQGLAFYAERFGMPFPQRAYQQAFLPDFGGAMENYGCVTWADTFLTRSAPTPAEQETFAKVLLHEMAHMWFGNIVTMRWWNDLWLNEAFAEFACNWAAVTATRYTDAWASHLACDKMDAYLLDQGPGSHPIRQPVRDVAEAAGIFDAITYPKGASVLAQLHSYVGEQAFDAGMRAYFARHAWGNTTLQDLVDALAEASGRDLDRWRAGWLDTAGPDRLRLVRDGERLRLHADGPDGGAPRPQLVGVGSYRREGDSLVRTALARVEVDGPLTDLDLPPDSDLHLVNDDDLTFAVARPEAGQHRALFEQAPLLPTAVSRGVAVATLWDMLLAGEARTADLVGTLTRLLPRETSETVLEPYLRLAGAAARDWSPEAERERLCRQVAEACWALAESPGRRQVALRAVAATEVDPAAVERALAAAGDDWELRWRLLSRRAALGAPPSAEELAEAVRRCPDPDAATQALRVRAATADPDAKQEVWAAAVVDRRVPVGVLGRVLNELWQRGQDDVVAPFAERFLERLPRFADGGMIPAMVLSARALPTVGVDEAFLDRVGAALDGVPPVVRNGVTERSEEVRRMLRARRA